MLQPQKALLLPEDAYSKLHSLLAGVSLVFFGGKILPSIPSSNPVKDLRIRIQPIASLDGTLCSLDFGIHTLEGRYYDLFECTLSLSRDQDIYHAQLVSPVCLRTVVPADGEYQFNFGKAGQPLKQTNVYADLSNVEAKLPIAPSFDR